MEEQSYPFCFIPGTNRIVKGAVEKGKKERGRERERILGRLHAHRAEPNAGLDLTTKRS